MSIMVVTRTTLSTLPAYERTFKVGISVGDVTLGDIGRYLWPHFTTMTCSSAQIYDKELEDFVDVLSPEELIVHPKNKVRLDFVHSNAVSVIRSPASFTVCGTSAGMALVIGQLTASANTGAPVDTSSVTKINKKQTEAETPRFDCNKVKKEVPVCYELQEDLSPDPTPTTSKKPRRISPVVREQVERSPEPVASPAGNSSSGTCLDHNQDIGYAENQIQPPENRKRRHSNSSASPAPKMPLAQSNRSPSFNLTTTNESEKVSENVSKKVVPVIEKSESIKSMDIKPIINTLVSENQKSESKISHPEVLELYPEQLNDLIQPELVPDVQIHQPKTQNPKLLPPRPKQSQQSFSNQKQLSKPRKFSKIPPSSFGRNYAHIKLPRLFHELKKRALDSGMRYPVLVSRIHSFKEFPDYDIIKMMSVVIADWLNCYAPEHSLNFRRAFIRDFLFKLSADLDYDTTVFTNSNGTGAVDLLIRSSEFSLPNSWGFRKPDIILEQQRWDQPTKELETNHYFRATEHREALMKYIKIDDLEVDVLFDHFPYLLSRTDLLERTIRLNKTFATSAQFIAKWNTKFSARIEELFNDSKIAVPDDLYPSGMCDRNSLMQFVHLFAITKQKCLPIQLIRDLVIIAKATDEETIHWIRTERAIAHPVILADKNGYRLFVGDRSIFRRTVHFPHVLAQLIIVSTYLDIFPVDWFCPLLHVLDRIYGIKTKNRSPLGNAVYCSIKDGIHDESIIDGVHRFR